MNFDNYTLEVL